MKQFQRLLQCCAVFLFIGFWATGASANEWLITVLSGNARADAWLIPADDDDAKAVLHVTADAKTTPSLRGRIGNIAFQKFASVENNAIYLTSAVLNQLLPQVKALQDDGKLGNTQHFSFLYAIAGLDAVDGKAYGYNPVDGRTALHRYESAIDERFSHHGLALEALVGAHDGSLILKAIFESGGHSDSTVIYDDTYGKGYRLKDGAVIGQSELFSGNHSPVGGFFHLGEQGGEALTGEDKEAAQKLTEQVRIFWKNKGLEYSPEDVKLRYSSNNRNELGGVLASLAQEPSTDDTTITDAVTKTIDALAALSLTLKTATPEEPATVKIIGYYGDAIANLPMVQKRFAEVSGGTLVPEIISGEQLNLALTKSAVLTFKQIMEARYGAAGI